MTFNYTASRNTASRLLAKFGQTATLKCVSKSGGNAWDATTGTTTTTNYTVTVCVVPQKQSEPAGSLTTQQALTVYLDALGLAVTPTVADLLTIGPQTYQIKAIEPLSPAGVVVMYTLTVVI